MKIIQYRIWGLVVGLLLCYGAGAQEDTIISNSRTYTAKLTVEKYDTLLLDSLTLYAPSVRIFYNKNKLDTTYYRIANNMILWKKELPSGDFFIKYKVLPFNLAAKSQHKDTTWIGRAVDDPNYVNKIFQYNPNDNRGKLITNSGLDYAGSYSRGVSFGNSQDVVLNSSFNMQLSGNLGDGVEIVAAISDNNVPIQPQGNTQQIQEFDKIFIQLRKNNTSLTAGDYELRRPDSYFINYYKKLQGLTLATAIPEFYNGKLTTSASVAISRGKFARNIITAIEGNQGPYKLKGANGEQFIIVLAGTEKVFIDGRLVDRGQNQDYIIDYNRGEITFTPNLLITKDIRIQVEFEYNDLNFNRSLYAVNTGYLTDKLKLNFNIYSEQDGKTSTTQGQLTEAQQQALANIGDDVGNSFFTGIDSTGFDPERVLYKLIDTTVNGITYDSVVVYSTNTDSALYQVRFSEIIGGKGNYIRLPSSANGTVFGWVAPNPITGEPSGTHEPVIQLVAPSKRQLYALGMEYQLSKTANLQTELTISNRDLNRLSALDGSDNIGVGAKVIVENTKPINKEKGINLTTTADYEFVTDNFSPINPYRGREFSRDWNSNNLGATNEHIGSASVGLTQRKFGSVNYRLSTFLKDSLYTGIRHFANARMNNNGWNVSLEGNLTTAVSSIENSQFFRPKINISKKVEQLNGVEIGVYGEREQNQRRVINRDTLLASSFFYDMGKVFVRLPSSNNFQLTADYTHRIDYAPIVDNFTRATVGDAVNLTGIWNQRDSLNRYNSRLNWNVTYRNLSITDTLLTNQEAQETYLGRIAYDFTAGKGFVRLSTVYQINSGQEQKVQFNYVEVDAGQGTYTWIDRNSDGIKQLDEFEIAIYQDQADHIRLITFTDEFIRSNKVEFNQSLIFNPKALWFKEKGLKKFVSKFSTQSNIQINRKVKDVAGISPWNPLELDIADTALVALNSNTRNALFFNRIHPVFGAEIGTLSSGNRVVLTSGYESRALEEQYIRVRWNISKQINLRVDGRLGKKENDSEFFNSRDYALAYEEFSPELTTQFQQNFRLILKYNYTNSQNTIGENLEKATTNDFSTEFTYNQLSKSSVRLKFTYASVQFNAATNTPVAFAMLEGLLPGRNFLWNLTFRRTLAKNVELNMTYEGRKNGDRKIVHLGRASVRAMF